MVVWTLAIKRHDNECCTFSALFPLRPINHFHDKRTSQWRLFMSRVPKDRPHLSSMIKFESNAFLPICKRMPCWHSFMNCICSQNSTLISLSFKIQNLSLSLSVIKSNLSLWDDWANDGAFYIYEKVEATAEKPTNTLVSNTEALLQPDHTSAQNGWWLKIVYCEFLVELCCPPVNNVLIIKRTTTTPTKTWSLSPSLHRWETYEHLNVRRARET